MDLTPAPITAVVFDLGGVLIDWDPRYLYRQLFDDEAAMEWFLSEVTTPAWNLRQDEGRPWTAAVESLAAEHPDQRDLILAYRDRWVETLGEPIAGTTSVLDEVRRAGLAIYALSNWSAETFPLARPRFPFLAWFDGIVLSGEVGIVKPDRRIFEILLERFELRPAATLFIDDSSANVEAAASLGIHALRFEDAQRLRNDLVRLGVLPAEG
ncbi:MAG TPA: HAD family phosphatase [Candidatus Limnocylindrales bacterium]|nr:HAD family phosphatase [Candidatus Limnocylindrales bacterium]